MTWPTYVVPAAASLTGGIFVAALTYRLNRRSAVETELKELRLAYIACQEETAKLRRRVSDLERSLRALIGSGLKDDDLTEWP